MADALADLAQAISQGLAAPTEGARKLMQALFGGRYHARYKDDVQFRDALSLDTGKPTDVPFAGMINPNNPPSGVYGGSSIIWFPTKENGSLLTFVVGTGGLSPDEGLLTRPGHRRRVAALRRYLTRKGVRTWTKEDPTALGVEVPALAYELFPGFEQVLRRYGTELYAVAEVPQDPISAYEVVQAFCDLYAYERGWKLLKGFEKESADLVDSLRADLFVTVSADKVHTLLKQRRFVILQGPPGTGKTRMAEEVRQRFFGGHGTTVQFHPAVTYEDFIIGLAPDAGAGDLHFRVRPGWLLEAAAVAADQPYLLVIDEINRADLGKVLGEAIYLFEPRELGGDNPRTVTLPHPNPQTGSKTFTFPENLYVLGTMNTADRSIAHMDLAVRRRFAFVTVPPDLRVIESSRTELAAKVFGRLMEVFVEHAPDEALGLLPGHSYFIADTEDELTARFRYELIPLLDEYLQEGLVGAFAADLQAVRNAIEDVSEHGQWIG